MNLLEVKMKRLSIFLLLATALFLGGCETMAGLGKDIKSAGEALEKKAKKSSD
jgi:predicted small secreted protein